MCMYLFYLFFLNISARFDFIFIGFKRRATKEFLVCTNGKLSGIPQSKQKSLRSAAVDTKSAANSSEPLCNCLTMRIPSSTICAMFDLSA